jgi:hypothetical protein
MKKSELKQLIKEEIAKVLIEGFQGDDPEGDGLSGFRGAGQTNKRDGLSGFRGNFTNSEKSDPEFELMQKNRQDRLKYSLEGVRGFIKGITLDNNPYRTGTFEYDWWKKGWEEAELASIKRYNKK